MGGDIDAHDATGEDDDVAEDAGDAAEEEEREEKEAAEKDAKGIWADKADKADAGAKVAEIDGCRLASRCDRLNGADIAMCDSGCRSWQHESSERSARKLLVLRGFM